MKHILRIASLMIVLLGLVACQLPVNVPTTTAPGDQPNPTAGVDATTAPVQATQGVSGEMGKAEKTVTAFLSAYQDDPTQMKQFLSKKRIAKLPKGGALSLLIFNGNLEGFTIKSAAVSPANGVAQIEVEARVGGEVVDRIIILVKEGDQWMIDSVKKGKTK